MSILSNIVKGVVGVGKQIVGGVVGTAIGGPVGGVVGSALAGGIGGKGGPPKLPVLPGGASGPSGMLPAITGLSTGGKLALAGAAGAAAEWVIDSAGRWHRTGRRRRRKGISAKDLSSFKRVARLIDKYSKPVHHFRNIKK